MINRTSDEGLPQARAPAAVVISECMRAAPAAGAYHRLMALRARSFGRGVERSERTAAGAESLAEFFARLRGIPEGNQRKSQRLGPGAVRAVQEPRCPGRAGSQGRSGA